MVQISQMDRLETVSYESEKCAKIFLAAERCALGVNAVAACTGVTIFTIYYSRAKALTCSCCVRLVSYTVIAQRSYIFTYNLFFLQSQLDW
jgi:hypothetical protein